MTTAITITYELKFNGKRYPLPKELVWKWGARRQVSDPSQVETARGDTLLVAAQLGGSKDPMLTYIEIDTNGLPWSEPSAP